MIIKKCVKPLGIHLLSINLLFRSFVLILGCLVVVKVCCFLASFGDILFHFVTLLLWCSLLFSH